MDSFVEAMWYLLGIMILVSIVTGVLAWGGFLESGELPKWSAILVVALAAALLFVHVGT